MLLGLHIYLPRDNIVPYRLDTRSLTCTSTPRNYSPLATGRLDDALTAGFAGYVRRKQTYHEQVVCNKAAAATLEERESQTPK